VVKQLAARMFVYDPLNRPFDDGKGLKRDALLAAIDGLASIPSPKSVFRLVLTDADEVNLTRTISQMSARVVESYSDGVYDKAALSARCLLQLSAIEHVTVARQLQQCQNRLQRQVQQQQLECRDHCTAERFGKADAVIRDLERAVEEFDRIYAEFGGGGGSGGGGDVGVGDAAFPLGIDAKDVRKLQQLREDSRQRAEQRAEEMRRQEEALRHAQGQVDKLLKLLQEQKDALVEERRRYEEKACSL
jgi:hypothetical protein